MHRHLDDWLRSVVSRLVIPRPAGAHVVRVETAS
jgi:hypothetical protein